MISTPTIPKEVVSDMRSSLTPDRPVACELHPKTRSLIFCTRHGHWSFDITKLDEHILEQKELASKAESNEKKHIHLMMADVLKQFSE